MNKLVFWILSFGFIFAWTSLSSQEKDISLQKPSGNVSQPIQTAEEAEKWARGILGWDLKEAPAKAQKVVISKQTLPFLGKKLDGMNAWKIRFQDVDLSFLRENTVFKNPYIHEFEATILAETGQLVEIHSILPKGVTIEPPLMSMEEAEERYKMTSEMYEGFPEVTSEISFEEILESAFDSGMADIANAKEILGYYVVNSRMDLRPSQRIWILQLRGMPPYPAKGVSNASDVERSHLRLLFDTKGEFILGDNQP